MVCEVKTYTFLEHVPMYDNPRICNDESCNNLEYFDHFTIGFHFEAHIIPLPQGEGGV